MFFFIRGTMWFHGFLVTNCLLLLICSRNKVWYIYYTVLEYSGNKWIEDCVFDTIQ